MVTHPIRFEDGATYERYMGRWSQLVGLHQGDAMALPLSDGAFDVAVLPLVIFFIPDPATGVAELARVVSPEGTCLGRANAVKGRVPSPRRGSRPLAAGGGPSRRRARS